MGKLKKQNMVSSSLGHSEGHIRNIMLARKHNIATQSIFLSQSNFKIDIRGRTWTGQRLVLGNLLNSLFINSIHMTYRLFITHCSWPLYSKLPVVKIMFFRFAVKRKEFIYNSLNIKKRNT